MNINEILYNLCYKYNNDWDCVYKALRAHEVITQPITIKHLYISCMDNLYPKRLKQIDRLPFMVYYEGDLSLLKDDLIYIMGTNKFKFSNVMHYDEEEKCMKIGSLKLWISEKDNYKLVSLASKIVITKNIYEHLSEYDNKCLHLGLEQNADIYVVPTIKPSVNNTLIKEGAYLLDCKEDVQL